MMKKIAIILSILILNFPIFSGNISLEQKFKEANNLFSENKFEDALELYLQIINDKHESSELYYNTANTYYRLNKVGESIYYYEKAIQLEPNNKDYIYNLELANLRVKDKPAILPKNAIESFFQNIIFIVSSNFWAYTSIILFVIFLFVLFLYIKSQISKSKKIYFLSSIVILFFSVSSIVFMQYQISILNSHKTAIVINEKLEAKSSPHENANTLFSVYEGFKVKIENKTNSWSEIKLTDGKKAWIKEENLKAI